MVNYRNLNIEYITALIFGVLGFVLSLIIGFVSGNKIALIFVKSLIITIIFSIIGYVCLIVVKKFVPEIYQIFSNINENKEIGLDENQDSLQNSEVDITENITDDSAAEISPEPDQKVPDVELENEFNMVEKESSSDTSISMDKTDTEVISKNMSRDKNIKYEPKIAAQAIRTMLKRDE